MASPYQSPEDATIFIFLSLLLGIVVTYALTRTIPVLPYTVIVFILGILLAFLLTDQNSHDSLSESVQIWNSIEPELIFYIFLPPILFGESMNLNFYHFSASFKGCILIAGPGTVLQTFGVATVAYFVLPYKWNWTVCLIFGAITAATDPVAVVALLKEYGASKRLMYLIVGESLLNDGAALALYVMFFDWISKSQSNWSARRTIIYVVQVVALSPAIGIAFGLSTLALLRLLNKRMHAADSIMQISLTICCAYLSFYVAQHTLEISGALACCGAGLVLSRFGHPLLIRAESMRSVWEMLEWTVNTLIFILAGLIIGSGAISFFHGLDLAYILLMYTAVLLVRTCIVALFYPFLSSMGAGCSWREAMFLAFSGLRGSVCVALALSLVHSATGKAALLEVDRARSVFLLSGGVAACTLLFNGTLAGAVLRCLRLSPEGPHQKVFIMQQYVRKRIRLKSLTLLEHLQAKYPDSVNPSVVWKVCSILANPDEGNDKGEAKATRQDHSMESSSSANKSCSTLRSCSCAGVATVMKRLCASFVNPTTGHMQRQVDLHSLAPSLESRTLQVQRSIILPLEEYKNDHLRAQHGQSITYEQLFDQKLEHIKSLGPVHDLSMRIPPDRTSHCFDEVDSRMEEGRASAARSKISTSHANNRKVGRTVCEPGYRSTYGALEDPKSPQSNRSQTKTVRFDVTLPISSTETPAELSSIPSDGPTPGQPDGVEVVEIRRAFLEIVRVHYWRQIRSGRLPRCSQTIVILQNSIDYAVELSHTSGLDDWGFILQQHPHLFEGLHSSVVDDNEEAGLLGEGIDEESKLPGLADNDDAWPSNTRRTYPPFTDTPDENSHIRIGRQLHFDSVTNFFAPSTQTTTLHVEPVLPRVETSSQKHDCGRRGGDPYLLYCHAQAVYLLVAFIEAHEYAEEKIRFYVGSAEGVQTTDEEIVVEESRALVLLAKNHLYRIDRDIITCQLTKQAARMILHAQEDAITEFSEEGVITGHDAMMMLEEVYRDKAVLAKYRKDSFSMDANGDLQTSTATLRALDVCYYRLQRWVHNLWRRMTTAAAVGRCSASTECVPAVAPSSSGP